MTIGQTLLWSGLAWVLAAAAPAGAVGSRIGATARAEIRISVTLAKSMGVRPVAATLSRTGPQPVCVWSSLPLRSFTWRVEPLLGGVPAGRTGSASLAAAAARSAGACGQTRGDEFLIAPRVPGSSGRFLLILAPE